MSGRPVPSQLDQVLPRFSVQKLGPYHPFGRIRIAPFGKGGLRILGESGYILNFLDWGSENHMPSYSIDGIVPVVDPSSYVHPLASLIGDVIIGPCCYIGPF